MDADQLLRIERKKQGNHTQLLLRGEMTIYVAQQIKEEFLESLEDSQSIDVDLAEVSELDSAGLQQLYLLKHLALSEEKSFAVSAHSVATQEVLGLYGLQEQFIESPVKKKSSTRKKAARRRSTGKRKS